MGRINHFITLYLSFYKWLVRDLDSYSEEDKKDTHKLAVALVLTSMIMWHYVLIVFLYVDSHFLLLTGIITSSIHLLSIFLLRFGVKIDTILHIYIGSAFIFNLAFTYNIGGIFSLTIVWPSIFPLLAGIIRGRKALLKWLILSLASVTYIFYLGNQSFSLLSETGKTWVSINIALGYLLLNASLILMYIKSKEHTNIILEKRNESIHRLLKIVSHDIANPLTAMLFRLTMLKPKMENYTAEEKKLFKDIENSAEMMYMILKHTRSYESIGKEHENLSDTKVNLNEVIEYVEFTFREKIKNRKITINYDYEKNKSINFKGIDIEIKNQVFNNLFSNSVKFMRDSGEITISVKEDDKFIVVTYSDTGEGIEPSILKDIFRADVKTSKKGLEGEFGSGFGMPILYQTLKSNGGSVTVSSTMRSESPGDFGSTFVLKFLK